jgi:hypothetical protein
MLLAARGILIYKGSMKSKQAAPPLAGQKTPAKPFRRGVHQPPASAILALPKNGERARENRERARENRERARENRERARENRERDKEEGGRESDRGSE